MKKLLKIVSVFAVTLVAAMFMVACGNDSGTNNPDTPSNTTTSICNVDNLNGFYANIEEKKLYYFDIANNIGLRGEFSLVNEEPDENGLYQLRVAMNLPDYAKTGYFNKVKVNRMAGFDAIVIYHQWNEHNPDDRDAFISTYNNDDNKDLSKQFYAADEKIIYTKISGLDGFLAEVFPNKVIDKTDMTHVGSVWGNLIKAL